MAQVVSPVANAVKGQCFTGGNIRSLGQAPRPGGRVSHSWDRLRAPEGEFPRVGTGSAPWRESFPKLGQAPRPGGRVSQSWDKLRALEGELPRKTDDLKFNF